MAPKSEPKTELTLVTPTDLTLGDLLGGMEADKGLTQHFDPDQMVIPRLLLLQDLSPEIKENKAEYMPGAKPGLFCLPLFGGLSTAVDFIPSRFAVRYLAWKPRTAGGGLVSSTLTIEDVNENFTQSGPGAWMGRMAPRPGEDPVTVEVIETPEWIGYSRGANWPWVACAVSFPKTKSKVARAMNTTISMTKVDGSAGKFTPPSFYHQFRLTSALDTGGGQEYWSPRGDRVGWVTDPEVLADAKQLAVSAAKGEVVADDSVMGV